MKIILLCLLTTSSAFAETIDYLRRRSLRDLELISSSVEVVTKMNAEESFDAVIKIEFNSCKPLDIKLPLGDQTNLCKYNLLTKRGCTFEITIKEELRMGKPYRRNVSIDNVSKAFCEKK